MIIIQLHWHLMP